MGNEGQSRYGIMENLNQKKIDTQNKLNEIEKGQMQQEMQSNNQVDDIERKIEHSTNNYERDHQRWKKEKEVQLHLRKEEVKREIEKLESSIEDRDTNYKQEHATEIENLSKQLKDHKETWVKYTKIKNKEMDSLKQEIGTINESIGSLKEISTESSSKKE